MVELVPVPHDPWNDEPAPTPVGYPVTPDVAEANALGQGGLAAIRGVGRGLLNYMNWNMQGSPGFNPPDLLEGAAHMASEGGRIMTTPPPKLPPHVMNTDAGLMVRQPDGQLRMWKDVEPEAYDAFAGEIHKREDFGPETAAMLVGGGAPAAERGAAGVAGGKLLQPAERAALPMDEARRNLVLIQKHQCIMAVPNISRGLDQDAQTIRLMLRMRRRQFFLQTILIWQVNIRRVQQVKD